MFKESSGNKLFVYALIFLVAVFSTLYAYNKEPYTEGVFWQVSKDGEMLGHIYGTIHMNDEKVTKLDKKVMDIFDNSVGYSIEAFPSSHLWNPYHGFENIKKKMMFEDKTLADVAGDGFRLNRAAGENIIPGITQSSSVIETVLPFMKDKVASSSMTVPVPDGSTVDLTVDISKEATVEEINNAIITATKNLPFNKVLDITFDPIVSSDVVGNTHSGIVDGLATMEINKNKIKLLVWFDNGWGYSARIIDTINKLSEKVTNE